MLFSVFELNYEIQIAVKILLYIVVHDMFYKIRKKIYFCFLKFVIYLTYKFKKSSNTFYFISWAISYIIPGNMVNSNSNKDTSLQKVSTGFNFRLYKEKMWFLQTRPCMKKLLT